MKSLENQAFSMENFTGKEAYPTRNSWIIYSLEVPKRANVQFTVDEAEAIALAALKQNSAAKVRALVSTALTS